MLTTRHVPGEKRQQSTFWCSCLTFSSTYKTYLGKTPLALEESRISLPIHYSSSVAFGKEILEISASTFTCRKPRLSTVEKKM